MNGGLLRMSFIISFATKVSDGGWREKWIEHSLTAGSDVSCHDEKD